MNKYISPFVSALVFAFAALPLPSFAQATPETVVKNLYQAAKLKDLATMNKSELGKYFTKSISEDFYFAAHSEDGLDIDILYNSQDTKITEFLVGKPVNAAGKPAAGGDTVFVNVTFKNFRKVQKLRYVLNRLEGSWKIANIFFYAEGHAYRISGDLQVKAIVEGERLFRPS